MPNTREELAAALVAANAGRRALGEVDLSRVARLLEHLPEDMTATVEAGMSLTELQGRLRARGQWLPIDPPDSSVSVRKLLDFNLSGPLRSGYGTIREHVIGLTVALADGTFIRSGGKVVKNVAGYDLMKLFIGGRGTLGVIVEVTFKVQPIPAAEIWMVQRSASLDEARGVCERVQPNAVTPVAFDLRSRDDGFEVILAFHGSQAEVEHQRSIAGNLGFEVGRTDYFPEFFCKNPAAGKRSVLPTELFDNVAQLHGAEFVAHVANGVLYSAGLNAPERMGDPAGLGKRLKATFDAHGVFPQL